jgi:3',5'-cyclic-AMP phosphodiesterase
MLRFIHISDTHIHSNLEFTNYGHKPRTNLIKLLSILNDLPFDYDFVLHTGDVIEDRCEISYVETKKIFDNFKRKPVYFVVGNHDHCTFLQKTLLGINEPKDKYYYAFMQNGVQVVVLDSKGVLDPMGQIENDQLDWFSQYCGKDGPPLVIAMHHPAIPFGSTWLETPNPRGATMLLDQPERFLELVNRAKHRIKGIFLGHVHRAFQIVHEGVLFSSAPSAFGQLKTWPDLVKAQPAPEEAPGYCVVTVDETATRIQQYTFTSQDS